MADKFPSLTTAINLLDSARTMRYPADIRRNVILARSALYDLIVALDAMEAPRQPIAGRSVAVAGCPRATVMITCPVNGVAIPTDVEIDPESYRSAILDDNQIKCPSCGQWHQWSTKDTFLR
jgi:hypothetical protein